MKINVELSLSIVFLVVSLFLSFYLTHSLSDNYQQYSIARDILRNPDFLWKEIDTIRIERITGNDTVFNYPPLHIFGYAFFILLGISPTLWAAVLLILLIYTMYKLEKRAIPFLMLSFLFLHHIIYGFNDSFVIVLFLGAFYFFEKKPYLSGIFMGLIPLVKPIGFLIIAVFFLSFMLFKRKEWKKYIVTFIIAALVLSPWYLRNAYFFKTDILGILLGQSTSGLMRTEEFLEQGFQATQPERSWYDSTGFYPTPLDPLFYIGIAFFVFNIARGMRKKEFKLGVDHVFIISFVGLYFFLQAIHFTSFMVIRYYMFIFPLLAIQIVKGIPEKHLIKAYAIAFLIFLVWVLILPNYSYPQAYVDSVKDNCTKIRQVVGNDPIYLQAFNRNYIMYACDLNITSANNSIWTLDYDNGILNKTA